MKNKLRDVTVCNGPMTIYVDDNEVVVTSYQKEVRFPYSPKQEPSTIEEIAVHRKDRLEYLLTSDIYDAFEISYPLDRFDEETVKELLIELLEGSIQFLARISKEEDLAILIQTSYHQSQHKLISTIGLIGDARILFVELKEKEELGSCSTNVSL